ncbi:pyridoxamine 5'-phosphate oxidase family protein [Sphingorhabdus sp. SMR4y]|uniref:pyridoxamine 5'-phosphate oxidase family protein n=1 Tax=Sphingorhabdus sp. SMR4y TaxID=2584094 RepID=UPI000B5CBCD9|nr:pyridoxamine 5'-phosphate oxidase family protein [Sphingorhabdus sp. SMR4y]ASK88837.1 pyridoxamine 5'-phosphate oxidase [Sphingorhabdus sp. SMR4y]
MNSLTGEPADGLFHAGEIALQRSVGMAERMEHIGAKIVRDFMPDQHRDFYARLPFIIVAMVDPSGDIWPTMLTGAPGFISSPSARSLVIRGTLDAADPASAGAQTGEAIGMLGIELHTRRRNRMNGDIRNAGDGSLEVTVGQAFGNCPQYIQLRDYSFSRDTGQAMSASVTESGELTDEARAIIATADTFFVASYVDRGDIRQIDASHRGGKAGFVRIDEDGQLTIPDFSGNFHFNTLGNFLVNPRAGLLFVDFETGDILQITGTARIITDSPEIASFRGAERIWTFRPSGMVLRRGASNLRWTMRENSFSPKALRTGSWAEVAAELDAGCATHPKGETPLSDAARAGGSTPREIKP